jgi:site-specific recombinase XerD
MTNPIVRQQLETDRWLQSFSLYLTEGGKGDGTVRLYCAEIGHFLGWLGRSGKSLQAIVKEDILASRDELYIQGKRLSTINKYVSILTTFFTWAQGAGLVTHNPAVDTRYITPKTKQPPTWLLEEQEAALLDAAAQEKNPRKRARNEALLHVLLYAGLKLDEAANLRTDCREGAELAVPGGEAGGAARTIPVPEETSAKLRDWLLQRRFYSDQHAEGPYLFVTERSDRMQPRAIQYVLEKYSAKLGFTVSCHDLRNTFCRRLAVRDTPILLLKRWAGHKSFLTTFQYYEGLQ